MEGERCVGEDREGERQRTGCCVLSRVLSAGSFLFTGKNVIGLFVGAKYTAL